MPGFDALRRDVYNSRGFMGWGEGERGMAFSNDRTGWATRFGLVMAMAGNAVGLGNFLRFPGKAAPYGGAFMVPYFLALVLLGIPLMWMEWTIGRHGGTFGHGSTPGMFHRLWNRPISKYLGIFGILLPAMVGIYYIYIESWSLGYAWQTLVGSYWGKGTQEEMSQVFVNYLGMGAGEGSQVSFSAQSYLFFLVAFVLNIVIMSLAISKGIEVVAKYCMPLLLLLGMVLAIRVLTLPPMEVTQVVDGVATTRTFSITDGLAQIWRVDDWSVLKEPAIWLTATGQIFFTLSVGLGMVHSYASYLRKQHDLTLSGLTACAANEFVEVILGGTIVIPAAVVFFGVAGMQQTVEKGIFAIGFQALPVIFQQMPGGRVFGTMWFVLLFLAGLTSSMAMFTPLLLFLEDELRVPRRKAAAMIGVAVFLMMQPVILFMHRGVVDELDYWMGDFGLVLFGAIEAVVFAWIFGMKRGWREMHVGAELRVPRIFYYVMKYITPVYAVALVAWYVRSGLWDKIAMKGVAPENVPYLWLARGMILSVAAFLLWGIWHAWRTHPRLFEKTETEAASQ